MLVNQVSQYVESVSIWPPRCCVSKRHVRPLSKLDMLIYSLRILVIWIYKICLRLVADIFPIIQRASHYVDTTLDEGLLTRL